MYKIYQILSLIMTIKYCHIQTSQDGVTSEAMPEFEYYEFLNWICVHYFIYAVIVSQFLAWFLGSVLFSFVEYRW